MEVLKGKVEMKMENSATDRAGLIEKDRRIFEELNNKGAIIKSYQIKEENIKEEEKEIETVEGIK